MMWTAGKISASVGIFLMAVKILIHDLVMGDVNFHQKHRNLGVELAHTAVALSVGVFANTALKAPDAQELMEHFAWTGGSWIWWFLVYRTGRPREAHITAGRFYALAIGGGLSYVLQLARIFFL